MSHTCLRTSSIAAALAAVLLFYGCTRVESPREPERSEAPGVPSEGGPLAVEPVRPRGGVDLATAIIQVAKQNIPAVVHIDVTERQEVENPFFFFGNDPFFRRFFGGPQQPRKLRRETRGLGTGMIMDATGHILTNHHVVGGATKIEILMTSGHRYPARLVGTDPKTDLAVVKIDAKERLPHVTFGNSDEVEVGEWVVAIGHPRGLDQTVTQGIISAKHRRGITDPSSYEDFLQTDAAINPGNSGGPLLNLHGQVIGVNAAIASQSGGSEGIGFAIPSTMALHVARQIIAGGKVERGWLGVSIQDVTPELARSLKLPSLEGALVAEVVRGGPADKAGLRKGDVITTFGGNAVRDAGSLRNAVANTSVGTDVKLSAVRDGRTLEFTARVGDSQTAARLLAAGVRERLGVTVRPVAAREAERYGLDATQGVAVATVDRGGPLGAVGIEAGDLLLEWNGQPIEGMEPFVELVRSAEPGDRVLLLVLDHRSGDAGYVRVVVK